MSRIMSSSLSERHADLTERVILESAIAVLEQGAFNSLTARAVAKKAGMSERTVFRYFPTRDEFLDAIAGEVNRILRMPAAPQSMDELLAMPRTLYQSFEPHAKLIRAIVHTEVFPRMKAGAAQERWVAIGKLLDRNFRRATPQARKIATVNIRFYLSANTWQYYRFVFRFDFEETVACAETAIRQGLAALSS